MTKYVWAPNAKIAGDPQLIGRELDRLNRINGKRLTPKDVVAEARNEKNPLHRCFEWDDSIAGERWRESQARQVIRSIRVITEQPLGDEAPTLHRVFVNVVEPNDDGEESNAYVTVSRLLSEPELFEQARQQCLKDLRAIEKRYAEFEALAVAVTTARHQVEQLNLVAQPA